MRSGDWVFYFGPKIVGLRTGEEWGEVMGFQPTGIRVRFPFMTGGELWKTVTPEVLRTEEEQVRLCLGEDYA